MTDDAVPLWVTTRTTAIRGIAYAQGYRFAAHDPLAMGARFSDIEPANQAARDWRRRDLRGPERPRWRARRLIQVDDRIVREGEDFQSLSWPTPDWHPLNDPAEQVAAYQQENHGRGLPHPAWDIDGARVNSIEVDAARRAPAPPPEDPRPVWPMGGEPPAKDRHRWRLHNEAPRGFTPSASPSATKFPPRHFVKSR